MNPLTQKPDISESEADVMKPDWPTINQNLQGSGRGKNSGARRQETEFEHAGLSMPCPLRRVCYCIPPVRSFAAVARKRGPYQKPKAAANLGGSALPPWNAAGPAVFGRTPTAGTAADKPAGGQEAATNGTARSRDQRRTVLSMRCCEAQN